MSASKAVRWLPWGALIAIWMLLAVRFFWSYALVTPYGHTWGVADDVYVTADFARTLFQGQGLKWHPDAANVEGFSSPTWVLVLAALHALPGFEEDLLGLYVLGVNLAILVALVLVLRSVVHRALQLGSAPPSDATMLRCDLLFVMVAVPAGLTLVYFTAEGFEVAFVALLVLSACAAALHLRGPRVAWTAVLVGLAIWTRMDAALPACAATVLLLARERRLRPLGLFVAIVVAMVGAMFAARYAYYGVWLPNTYYLKATGWPLSQRVPHGTWQNFPALVAFTCLIPFGAVVAWRGSRAARIVALTMLAAHLAVCVYSTALGGDFTFEAFGFDRFTSVTSLFVAVGVATALHGLRARRSRIIATAALGALGVAVPFVYRPSFHELFRWREQSLWISLFNFDKPLTVTDALVQRWVHQGKAIGRVTKPRARVAVCAAGATIYFSRRRGVDLLGKVDAYIARLPASPTPPPEARCWRALNPIGHNKEDVVTSFRLHRPDVSVVPPPANVARQFKFVRYEDVGLWVRRRSRRIDWQELRRR